ncbi:uncharacterized protein [Argopecten irradians]|uniref:uncharacterized protein n=1 Tax=Argopecten irradians TaxID=31199 RepID=UPI00371E4497
MKMDEIHGKSVAQKLKSEYAMKSSRLSELKEQITSIKKEILRMLHVGQESGEECQKRLEVTSLVEAVEWRKKLHQLTSQLQNIHLDDSTEHRSLKQLQRYIQLSLLSGPQLDTEVYELLACVADLNLIHRNLCEAKEEIENEINTALRILAKALLHITAEYDPSIEGNCTDYMAHFVKQHVSPHRRKLPLSDLTNRIVPSAPQSEGADITYFTPQAIVSKDSSNITTDYVTDKTNLLKIQASQNICSHSSRDILSIDKQNVHLQEMREKDKENRRLPHTSNGDHSNHLSANHYRTNGACAATYSRMNCKQGVDKENSMSVNEATQGFSVRSRTRTEPGIGMECRLHGSSGGNIKLSHFSTPSKGVFTPIAENRHFSKPSKAVLSPPRIDSAYGRQQIQVHEKVRNPTCEKNQKPLLNTLTERRDVNETAGDISAGEHAMGIPYIDDDSS